MVQIGPAKSCKGPGCSDRYNNPKNLGRKQGTKLFKWRSNVKKYKPVNRGRYGYKVKYRKYNNIRKRGWGKNVCQKSPSHKKQKKWARHKNRNIKGGLFRKWFVVNRSSNDQICGSRVSVRHKNLGTVCQPKFKMKASRFEHGLPAQNDN